MVNFVQDRLFSSVSVQPIWGSFFFLFVFGNFLEKKTGKDLSDVPHVAKNKRTILNDMK